MPTLNQDEKFTVSPFSRELARPSVEQSAHPAHLAMRFGAIAEPGRDEPVDEARAFCRSAVDRCRSAWSTIAAKCPKENGLDSPQRLLADWSRVAKGETAAAGARVGVAREKVTEEIKKLDLELNKPPEASPAAAEIRAYVRGLDKLERMQFLRRACEDEDGETLAAVLSGPAYLTGLGPEDVAELRKRWQAAAYPDQVARRVRLEEHLRVVAQAERALQQNVDSYINSRLSGAARAAAVGAAA